MTISVYCLWYLTVVNEVCLYSKNWGNRSPNARWDPNRSVKFGSRVRNFEIKDGRELRTNCLKKRKESDSRTLIPLCADFRLEFHATNFLLGINFISVVSYSLFSSITWIKLNMLRKCLEIWTLEIQGPFGFHMIAAIVGEWFPYEQRSLNFFYQRSQRS